MNDQHLDTGLAGEPRQAVPLADSDLPGIFRASDAVSLLAQRQQVRATASLLMLTVLATIFATITIKVTTRRIDVGAALAGLAFLLALCCGAYVQRKRPEGFWYRGRALAESARTLSWLYAVGGGLFNVDSCAKPEDELMTRLGLIAEKLHPPVLSGGPVSAGVMAGGQITENMRAVRSAPLATRKSAYLTGRLEAQMDWYNRKAAWNAKRESAWRYAILVLLGFGVAAAVARVTGLLHVNLLSVPAVTVAATVAWLEAKDHGTLAEAYSVTAIDLSLACERALKITADESEHAWALFVEGAEHAISREHTLWLARGGARYR